MSSVSDQIERQRLDLKRAVGMGRAIYSLPVPVAHPRPASKRPRPHPRRVERASLPVEPSLRPEDRAILDGVCGGVEVHHGDDRPRRDEHRLAVAVENGRVPDGLSLVDRSGSAQSEDFVHDGFEVCKQKRRNSSEHGSEVRAVIGEASGKTVWTYTVSRPDRPLPPSAIVRQAEEERRREIRAVGAALLGALKGT